MAVPRISQLVIRVVRVRRIRIKVYVKGKV